MLAQQLLQYSSYAATGCTQLAPGDVTADYIHTSFEQPVLVPVSGSALQGLGMALPPAEQLTVSRIAEVLGYEKEV